MTASSDLGRYGAIVLLVSIPPLLAAGLTRFPRARSRAGGALPSDAPEPPRTSGPGPRCRFVEPAFFTIQAGASQRLRAFFTADTGVRAFEWTSNGGSLRTPSAEDSVAAVTGRVVVDVLNGPLDPALWSVSRTDGARIQGTPRGVVVTLPAATAADGRVALRSVFPATEDFTAELTVTSLVADGHLGSESIVFVADDGFSTFVERAASTSFFSVGSEARKDGKRLRPFSIFDVAGERRLQMSRRGGLIRASFWVDGREVPLGDGAAPATRAPGRVEVETWSIENRPTVTSSARDFWLRVNDEVVWQAPAGATLDDSFTIRLDDSCAATAKIGARP